MGWSSNTPGQGSKIKASGIRALCSSSGPKVAQSCAPPQRGLAGNGHGTVDRQLQSDLRTQPEPQPQPEPVDSTDESNSRARAGAGARARGVRRALWRSSHTRFVFQVPRRYQANMTSDSKTIDTNMPSHTPATP